MAEHERVSARTGVMQQPANMEPRVRVVERPTLVLSVAVRPDMVAPFPVRHGDQVALDSMVMVPMIRRGAVPEEGATGPMAWLVDMLATVVVTMPKVALVAVAVVKAVTAAAAAADIPAVKAVV